MTKLPIKSVAQRKLEEALEKMKEEGTLKKKKEKKSNGNPGKILDTGNNPDRSDGRFDNLPVHERDVHSSNTKEHRSRRRMQQSTVHDVHELEHESEVPVRRGRKGKERSHKRNRKS